MRKLLFTLLTLALSFSGALPANAEAKWSPITESDYIFGYTSYKYSCWSGVTNENLPVIEVYSNNNWVTAVTGQLLPVGSDIKTPCDASFPIAVGFSWTVMAPAPPSYQTNRYTALYRQRIPDKTVTTQKLVTTQVYEDQEFCCESKTINKKVPYIAKVKKNGKFVNVIKYKWVKSEEQVKYVESVLVDKSVWQDVSNTVKGWVGESGNISIYPSVNAMNAEAAAMANAIACAFGFSSACAKKP
jgi:hypothetical protein